MWRNCKEPPLFGSFLCRVKDCRLAGAPPRAGPPFSPLSPQPRDNALERKAADYIRFREDVAAIEAMKFDNASVTREAHRRLSAHDSEELSAGWVAYAALVAADTPAFAKAMQKEMKRPRRARRHLVPSGARSELRAQTWRRRRGSRGNPRHDRTGRRAHHRARRGFQNPGLRHAENQMGQTAHRREPEASWWRGEIGAPDGPGFERSTHGGVTAPSLASASSQWAAGWGENGNTGHMTEANAQVIIDRALNLAARYSANALNDKVVSVYAVNNKSERCLSMAKLTLDQCIAATRTPYEEAFCLGEHGLNDISTCVGWVAGVSGSW